MADRPGHRVPQPSLPPDPRSIWVTDDPPEDSARAHKHRLVRKG